MGEQNSVIKVAGMCCNHCATSIKQAVEGLAGVTKAEVDLAEKSVAVDYDDAVVQIESIKSAIEDQGYDVD